MIFITFIFIFLNINFRIIFIKDIIQNNSLNKIIAIIIVNFISFGFNKLFVRFTVLVAIIFQINIQSLRTILIDIVKIIYIINFIIYINYIFLFTITFIKNFFIPIIIPFFVDIIFIYIFFNIFIIDFLDIIIIF